jgi:hypothetical protein
MWCSNGTSTCNLCTLLCDAKVTFKCTEHMQLRQQRHQPNLDIDCLHPPTPTYLSVFFFFNFVVWQQWPVSPTDFDLIGNTFVQYNSKCTSRQTDLWRHATQKTKGRNLRLGFGKKGKIFPKSIESVLSFGNFSKKGKTVWYWYACPLEFVQKSTLAFNRWWNSEKHQFWW